MLWFWWLVFIFTLFSLFYPIQVHLNSVKHSNPVPISPWLKKGCPRLWYLSVETRWFYQMFFHDLDAINIIWHFYLWCFHKQATSQIKACQVLSPEPATRSVKESRLVWRDLHLTDLLFTFHQFVVLRIFLNQLIICSTLFLWIIEKMIALDCRYLGRAVVLAFFPSSQPQWTYEDNW